MADPIKLQVLKALTAHLEFINPVNGFDYDLRGAVFRGRNLFGAETPKTMVTFIENPRPDYGEWAGGAQMRKEDWPILVQGKTNDDGDHPSDEAYILASVVENRLMRLMVENQNTGSPKYPDEFRLGRLVAGIRITPAVVRPPTDGLSSSCFFYMPVAIELATDFSAV